MTRAPGQGRRPVELVEAGQVTPAVDRAFLLDETPAAIRYLRAGETQGKVVVEV